jgi:hypothetical protein
LSISGDRTTSVEVRIPVKSALTERHVNGKNELDADRSGAAPSTWRRTMRSRRQEAPRSCRRRDRPQKAGERDVDDEKDGTITLKGKDSPSTLQGKFREGSGDVVLKGSKVHSRTDMIGAPDPDGHPVSGVATYSGPECRRQSIRDRDVKGNFLAVARTRDRTGTCNCLSVSKPEFPRRSRVEYLKAPSNLGLPKPSTDILLFGHAWAPNCRRRYASKKKKKNNLGAGGAVHRAARSVPIAFWRRRRRRRHDDRRPSHDAAVVERA